jgi:hypothetical protein
LSSCIFLANGHAKVELVQHGDGFLNGIVPDLARMLYNQLTASSVLSSVLSENSNRGNVLRFNQ